MNHNNNNNNNKRQQSMSNTNSTLSSGTTDSKISSSSTTSTRMYTTLVLRLCFLATVVTAAAVCGYAAYVVMRGFETDLGEQNYESIAASALDGAQALAIRKLSGAEVVSSVISNAFPDAEQWPMVALSGFPQIFDDIGKSSTAVHGVLTIVNPGQVTQFNDFAYDVYEREGLLEYGAGQHSQGFGIWKLTGETKVPVDVNNTIYDDEHNFFTPALQGPNAFAGYFGMHDIHASNDNDEYIESVVDCSRQHVETQQNACVAMAAFSRTVLWEGPSSWYFTPVYPRNDTTTIVGFTATGFWWKSILENVVPDNVNGLDCVISSETEAHTFSIQNGVPVDAGSGDLHDRRYDGWRRHAVLNAPEETTADLNVVYTLSVYPTQELLGAYSTGAPRVMTIGLTTVIVFCGVLFLLYDFFMRGESRERRLTLEVKRRFVRFISHEIRNPLQTVSMGVEMMLADLTELVTTDSTDDTLDRERLKSTHQSLLGLAGSIQENVRSGVAILDDVLQYDKIETGTIKLETAEVDVWSLVRETVSSFEIQAKTKKMDLVFHGPTTGDGVEDVEAPREDFERLVVMGDDLRLRQVIRNLLSNAIKFGAENGGQVVVTATHDSDGLPDAKTLTGPSNSPHEDDVLARAGSIEIRVKDNGAGMTEEQLKSLFGEGVQFEANRLQAGGGSGLGLFISKGLVEQHGGKIWATSDGRNSGTTFIVELPLHRISSSSSHYDSPQRNESKNLSPTVAESKDGASKTCRVLVVDDVALNRKMLIRLLERGGHTCVEAANGEEAVSLCLDSTHFDIVLLDYEMPVMNGPTAAQILRERGYRNLIVGLTGNVLADDVAFFKSMGANDVIAKPISLKQFESLVIGAEPSQTRASKSQPMECSVQI